MDEYVPTEVVKRYFREIVDVLVETRQRPTERVCIWISGFFGSGKSHFLKVLGYLLEDHLLRDPDGLTHSSTEVLCRKLSLENFLNMLRKEVHARVVFINLLDYDSQSPQRPTISRLIYRSLLAQKGFSTEFWVAEWEMELSRVGKWDEFQAAVKTEFGRTWEEERKLHAEVVLRRILPRLLPQRYKTEEDAVHLISDSKRRSGTINPSDVVSTMHMEARDLHPQSGRIVVMLDEVGLYIGDSIERLTDLNALAEQVVQQGDGKVMLVATAQEALTEMVPRLTADREILEWLRDRFRLLLGLEPTEVQTVIANRILAKTSEGAKYLQGLYKSHQGRLLSNLTIERSWREQDFIDLYPCHPYAVRLMQDIMGAMRGSIEEARRLSGSARSLLKLIQVILTGEAGVIRGAEQEVNWLASLDSFYDAVSPDLSAIRSEQVRVIQEISQLPETGLVQPVRVAKALFLLQQLRKRLPCTVDTISSALVDNVEVEINTLRTSVQSALTSLQQAGWVTREAGEYRLLTRTEQELERDVRSNYPTPAELKQGAISVIRDMLQGFRYEHGQIRRILRVGITIDGPTSQDDEDLKIELYSPFAEERSEDIIAESVARPNVLIWKSVEQAELKPVLERVLAVEKVIVQWQTRSMTREQEEHRDHLVREIQIARQTKLPELMFQAFINGRLYLTGRESAPSGNDLEGVLRSNLQKMATQVYTEFIDDKPDHDEECADILSWQPGAALPQIYRRRNLLTTGGRINHDAGLLSIIRSELTRRQQLGLPTTGKDILEHFQGSPYGYDPRLVRLLVATTFKAGLISVKYQNRDLMDPTDRQAGSIFATDREFRKASFALLPEVDWRKASDMCSSVFGVEGGDTFERTAAIVLEQAAIWGRDAQQLATRCRDNRLPASLGATCERGAQILAEIAQLVDPNARLRRFLDQADSLNQKMPLVRELDQFQFDQYRGMRTFVQVVSDWGSGLTGDLAQRWSESHHNLEASDLPRRWGQLHQDYALLFGRYCSDYSDRHKSFQSSLQQVLHALREHPAYKNHAEALKPLLSMVCDVSDPSPSESAYTCPGCGRSFSGLLTALLIDARHRVEDTLDSTLSSKSTESVEPMTLTRTIGDESGLEELNGELRRYWRKVGRPLRVDIKARVKDDEP
jgi:hypothetical protein